MFEENVLFLLYLSWFGLYGWYLVSSKVFDSLSLC